MNSLRGAPDEVLKSLIDVYSEYKGVSITKEQKQVLAEYLVPYMKLSSHVPSETEVKALAAALQPEKKKRIEELLKAGTADSRKALYLLLKIKDRAPEQSIFCPVRPDSEEVAHQSAKNACIGIYLSWFREIAEGRGKALKLQIDAGLFDICYLIYTSGQAYLYLFDKCEKEDKEGARIFYAVVKRHLDRYREETYREESADLFEFLVKNGRRMKWVLRLCHLAQEFVSFENEEGGSKCVLRFATSLQRSPWTEELGREVVEEYKKPLSERVARWVQGEPARSIFVKEVPGKAWGRHVLVEDGVPEDVGIKTAKEIVYLGRARRLLEHLGVDVDRIEGVGSAEPCGSVFDAEETRKRYLKMRETIKSSFFEKYKVIEHLHVIRDVFFLFREDFFNDLFLSLSEITYAEEAPAAVDEALEKCFGEGMERFIDVVKNNTVLSLVYRPVFPYSVLTENISGALAEAFEYFWALRAAIRRVKLVYDSAERRAELFDLVVLAERIAYFFFEKVTKGFWDFRSLPGDLFYDPEKLSKVLESTCEQLLSTCKASCTLSVLSSILTTEPLENSAAQLRALLQKITYE